jgi:Domain of unknown function (DUF3471)
MPRIYRAVFIDSLFYCLILNKTVMKRFIFSTVAFVCFAMARGQDTTLNEYVGTYKFPEGSVVLSVDIKIENGALMANSSAGSSALEKISKDTFNLVSYSGTVYFTRDADKKVNGIKIEVQDTVLEGKKENAGLAVRYFKEWLYQRKNLTRSHIS